MVEVVQANAENTLRVAVERAVNDLLGGDEAGDGLQLVLAACIVPLSQAGDLLLLDKGHHILCPGSAFGGVQGRNRQHTVCGDDARNLRTIVLDSSQTHNVPPVKIILS